MGENPVRMLRSLNIASPEQIQDYLQRYFGVGALGKQALKMLDETYQSFVPVDIAIHYSCFGLGEDSNVLYVAMEDPSDRGIVNQLRFFLNKRIVGVSATVFQLAEGLSKIYKVHKSALNLTTILENTRGVIAGIRYEVPHKVEAISIDDDFVSSNLKDSDSQDDEPVVAKKSAKQPDKVIGSEAPEAEAEAKESNSGAEPSAEISVASEGSEADKMPSVGFIDGSSGEVDNAALTEENPSAEVAAGETETPMEASAGEETPIVEEAPQEIAEDAPIADDAPMEASAGEETPIAEEAPQEIAEDAPIADDAPMEASAGEETPIAEEAPQEIAEDAPIADDAPMEASAGEETPIAEEAPQEIAEDAPMEASAGEETPIAEEAPQEIAEDAPMEASAGDETPIAEEAPQEIAEDSPQEIAEDSPQEIAEDSPQEIAAKDEPVDIDSMEEPQELDLEAADDILADDVEMESEEYAPHEKTFETPTESMTVQLSSLASSALVKLSLIDDKDQAVEMINSLLKPFNTSVTLFDAEKYLIEGEDFSVEGDLTSEIRAEGNSVAFAIEPILKRVLKMKDEL
ncbi:hypothetical protein JCM31447_11860 [Fluviispira sanaruensis]|uniref:Type II secretion system protein GspE N-terminal domain-containing protein n=1 Tax=Fluviispira sanaruensis TaxID=2493639 RepID=A0A4P2VLB4_FLUSA|nr:hypothetical protein JCM31447_11860 [Fluviispira sanaruensis]